MKWLIFLALITSCGKHTQPDAVDLNDDDGDQILNYQESAHNKEFANVPLVGPVSGALRIFADQIIDLPLANDVSHISAADVLASVEERLKFEEHFSEWSELKINKKVSLNKTKGDMVNFEIILNSGSDLGGTLFVVEGKTRQKIADISQAKYTGCFSKARIQSLIDGKAKLYLTKNFHQSPFFREGAEETIKAKTYRVHFSDGKNSSVLYVSKNLSFKDLMQKLNIAGKAISELDLFTENSRETQWFYREFQNGEKAIVLSTALELNEKYLSRFDYKKITLSRDNGVSTNKMVLKNFPGARIYLRARSADRLLRTFGESKKISYEAYRFPYENRSGPSPDAHMCTRSLRNVESESPGENALQEGLNDLVMTSETTGSQLSYLGNDFFDKDNVPYIGEVIEEAGANVELGLQDMPKETFTTTGEYISNCQHQDAASSTNVEAKMSLVIESFVEKPQE